MMQIQKKAVEALQQVRNQRGWFEPRGEVDSAFRAAESVLAAVVKGPYRTMRSAPKSGDAVLILIDGSDIPMAARWIGHASDATRGQKYSEPGWYLTWDGYRAEHPRYWMPIPDDPDQ